ncbi:DUF4396 domain-containing protein [Candidatus Pantoea multigeneris]|uniref:DUF4396 domain-containing protein n=1 Tax=Candidatus Pantoea multigeneris TaxID=2608357 RepID=A0ABX0RBJ9_9GAMM|nr:DUF4396 domain-containing protein [Pantoea multigeneris]NIF20620.1 DUF4396 domain-containing protein [Pantoea multigeneris]
MLNQLALPFLITGLCTALMILKDIFRFRHPVTVMNVIWPLTGLYMPFIGWVAWWYLGRKPGRQIRLKQLIPQAINRNSGWQTIFVSTSLSAAACILAEVITIPIVTALNYFSIFPALWHEALITLPLCLFVGLFFQFLAIRQREGYSFWRVLGLACKTEIFPLLIFQAGVFLFMALALKYVLNQEINPLLTHFWFMLQLAILTGFVFSWPASHFVIKRGLTPVA